MLLFHRRPVATRAVLAACLLSTGLASAGAQRAPSDTAKTYFVRHDLEILGGGLALSGVVSIFDKRVANWALQPNVQGSSSRQRVVGDLTRYTGETWFTWAAVAGYGVGRLVHSQTTADVSLHTLEAQALTTVFGQAIRGVIGRARPAVDPNDPYHFHWGQGFSHFNDRSYPSLHSAAGFVLASAVTTELHYRDPGAVWYAAPILYGVALVPGLTRIYNGQHWASDVAAGAVLGTFFGNRVVHYAHTHGRNKLDRALLGVSVMPSPEGGAMLEYTIIR
jgi:membrane-associated phospholipid phosphatase